MDRSLVYPGSIPLDTDILNTNRNAMVALGYLAQAVLGTGTSCRWTQLLANGAGLADRHVGPGSITTLSVVDTLAYGSLPADTTTSLVKHGINLAATSFTLAPPVTSGQSINYLIQAALQESDTNPVVLPYYNAANPAQPYSGPTTPALRRTPPHSARATPAQGGRRRQFRFTGHPADRQWLGGPLCRHAVVRSDSDRRAKYCAIGRRAVHQLEASDAAARALPRPCRPFSPPAPLPCLPVSPRRKSRFGVAVREHTPRSAAFRAVAGPVAAMHANASPDWLRARRSRSPSEMAARLATPAEHRPGAAERPASAPMSARRVAV